MVYEQVQLMFMQIDVALISSSRWACEIGEVEGPRGFGIYRHLSFPSGIN